MTDRAAYVIGIRIDPGTEEADWFTVWFEDDGGQNWVVSRDGRAQWSRTVEDARELALTTLDNRYAVEATVDSICDVAASLYAIAMGEAGSEGAVLMCLNLLDDVLKTIGHASDLPNSQVLDRLVALLTEGEPLTTAVDRVGGKPAAIEPIVASLGRLFTWSTFRC